MNEIRLGDCRDVMRAMKAPKDARGRFVKGAHWRSPGPHWDKEWLEREYTVRGRSAAEIAIEVGCKGNNVLYWLKKHGIPRRTVAQVRARKHWGATGPKNPMFGRTGALNPHYVNGGSPERQRLYAGSAWKEFVKAIYQRDGYCCRRCGANRGSETPLHAHHIRPWAGHPELRMEESNVVSLCRPCHRFVHSKKNTKGEFLS